MMMMMMMMIDSDHRQNLVISFVAQLPPFRRILWKTRRVVFCVILLITNKRRWI